MLKKIIPLMILITLFIHPIHAETLSPEQFLDQANNMSYKNRVYFGNTFMVIGGSLIVASTQMEDEHYQNASLITAFVSTLTGGALRLFPSVMEKTYESYQNGEISAIDGVKKIKKLAQLNRYISSGILMVGYAISISDDDQTSDQKLLSSGMYLGAAVASFLLKMPVEQMSEEVIEQNALGLSPTKGHSWDVQPNPSEPKVAYVYRF